MDANTTRDADAAELAALYQSAEEAGKTFAKHMEASLPLWQAVQDARAARDTFKRDFKAKHMGMNVKPTEKAT
ncbi:hypothetical protein ABIB06_006577 [Bradyrhizobium sp. LB8.2]|uniref:hypothetical protein n=1 Tax=unclassified Bradyrhizobium TaxID=2631580 RepID=UPI0033972E0A